MFDIRIGTIIPAAKAEGMIPQLVKLGFESFELDFNGEKTAEIDFDAYAAKILPLLGDARISAVGYYANPILNPNDRENLKALICSAPKLGCSVVGAFAGADSEKSVPDNIPLFVSAWSGLSREAEDRGVRIGFEGCGGGWRRGCGNIAYCPDAWERMFDAIDSRALGLEWEPCHALEKLSDPIAQLRKWADRVVHVHGKDATVAWDVIAEHGIAGSEPYVWNRTPGFGDSSWSDIFTILLQHGFEGSCDIEGYHDPVHYDDMEWTAQLTALKYLKNCRGGESFIEGPAEYRGYQGARKHVRF